MIETLPFTLSALREAYAACIRPEEVVDEVYRRIEAANDPAIFIHLRDADAVRAEAAALGPYDPQRPLRGVPFVIKDIIDAAGLPTTAACPAHEYTAGEDAFVVARLKAAGALLIGKTNLDQFATGLAGQDALCAAAATIFERGTDRRLGATRYPLPARTAYRGGRARTDEIEIAVCGAHMSGLPLNHELTGRGGRFLSATRSAPAYRLYALAGGPPFRPGMLRVAGGQAIELEVWALPAAALGGFMRGIPAPLAIGTVELQDGRRVKGFLVESSGTADARDITAVGGWRAFLGAEAEVASRPVA